MARRVEEMAGPKSTTVWVVLDTTRANKWVGKVVVHHGSAAYAAVWDNTPEQESKAGWGVQQHTASGYGYDKLGASIAGAILKNKGFGRMVEGAPEWSKVQGAANGAGSETLCRAFEANGYEVVRAL